MSFASTFARCPRALAGALVALALVAPGDLFAQPAPGSPVVVTSGGPKAIRIELAAGNVIPCDSSSNTPIYLGTLQPGATLVFESPSPTVCFRQTFDNFPEVNWSSSQIYPLLCRRRGGCATSDPTIRIALTSTQP